MRLLPLPASLLFPASATAGLPVPPALVPLEIARPRPTNSALAARSGFYPRPDITLPLYHLPAAWLLAVVKAMTGSEPRATLQIGCPAGRQVDSFVGSRVPSFPALVLAATGPGGATGTAPILYSRSVSGCSDFGVNHAHLRAGLAQLDRRVAHCKKR